MPPGLGSPVQDPLEGQSPSLFEQTCETFLQKEGKNEGSEIQHAVRTSARRIFGPVGRSADPVEG